MTEFENNAYGMTTDEIRTQYMNSLTAKLSGLEMVVAGILSDCQEELCAGPANQARIAKQLNVAKFILGEMMDQNDIQKRYAKRKAEVFADPSFGGFTI